MGEKVTFDPLTKIIQVDLAPVDGEVFIDVKVDIYSDGKEDWKSDATLNKFRFPVTAVGGNPLPGSKSLGSTFFLEYGWKIRPYEGTHVMNLNGNMYARDGSNPYLPTTGVFNVQIIQSVSSLVDSTVQQLSEIEYGSFGGGVCYDSTSPYSGILFPNGTPQQPVNSIYDAHDIAVERGFITFFLMSDLDMVDDLTLEGYTFIGQGKDRTHVNIPDPASVSESTYIECHVQGYLDGNNTLRECLIQDLHYIKGYIEQCVLSPGTIVLAGSEEAHFLDCWSGVPGTDTPTIDVGSGQALAMRNYNGGIRLTNKSGPESVSIDLNSGQIRITDTVTAGKVVARGVGKIIDDTTLEHLESGVHHGVTVLNETINRDVISQSPTAIAGAVWDASAAIYLLPGSMGEYLQKKVLSVKKFIGLN